MTKTVTFQVKYDLGRDDLVCALAWTQRNIESASELPWHWTKAKIVQEIRETLTYAGKEKFYYWRDDLDEATYEELSERIERWALTFVAKAFPRVSA